MKLTTALAALQKGAWSNVTAYVAADIVTSGGSSYICILAHTNHVPPNGTYWALLADKGDAGDDGSNGTNGTDTNRWYSGSGAPGGGLGSNDDFYLDEDSGDVYEKAGGVWSQIANIGGPVNARRDEVKTTGSLANLATENGDVTLGKSFLLLKLEADRDCRVRLYSTAAARTADASRLFGTDPAIGTQHGVICDLILTTADGLVWILSPQAPGSCMESVVTRDISYAIQNLSGSTSAVEVTFTVVETEA